MSAHLSAEEIKNYLARKLARDDFDGISEHVHSCQTCYQDFLAELQKRLPIEIDLDELAGLKEWHLEGRELAAYVEGRMDDLDFECASLHLQECDSCMEKASAASEYPLAHPSLKNRTLGRQRSTWNRHVPSFQSVSLPRLRLPAAAVLLVGLALMSALLQSRSGKPQLAGGPPPETRSPDPSAHQPTVSVQPGPGAASDIAHKIGGAVTWQMTDNSQERGAGRQEHEIERALIAKNLTMPPAIEALDRTPAIAVRGNRASIQSFTIVRPLTTLINSDRPTFCWTALGGATSYVVSVYDSALHTVRTSQPLKATQWSMPERLEAGIKYTWMVTALKDGQEIIAPPSPARAEFKILGKSELIMLKRRINRTASHAVRGVLYAEAGLLDEAEEEFQTHVRNRPSDVRAKRLLQTVRSWRAEVASP